MGDEVIKQTTETVATEPVEQETQAPEGGRELNPAWGELLDKLPSSLHEMITPHLTQWDTNFQTELNKVHSQYEGYKPFLDNQVTPEQLHYAMQVVQAIEQRPMDVYKGIEAYARENNLWQEAAAPVVSGQQGQAENTEIPDELLQHPEFIKMQQVVSQLTEIFQSQQQSVQQEQADKQLADELSSLKSDLGEFDEQWVVTKALQAAHQGQNVTSLKPFVEAYQAFEKELIAKAQRPAPKVMSTGGIAPDSQMQTKNLTPQERRALVVQQLAAAAQNSQ